MTSRSDTPFSVRVRRQDTGGWLRASYHKTVQEAVEAAKVVAGEQWAVFFKGWKLTASGEPFTLDQLGHLVETLSKSKWFVRYYLSEWATSYNWIECKSKKEAEREAHSLRKKDPHSHAKVVLREPVTFANCFFRNLDS